MRSGTDSADVSPCSFVIHPDDHHGVRPHAKDYDANAVSSSGLAEIQCPDICKKKGMSNM